MGNFFLDNQDIQFLFDHIDLKELARIQEQRVRLQEQQQLMNACAGWTGTPPIVGICSALETDPFLKALSVLIRDAGD